MDKLAKQLIKLGHTNPELRDHLRPVLDHLHREAGLFDKMKRVLKRKDEDLSWLDRVDAALKKAGFYNGVGRQKQFVGYHDPVTQTRDGLLVSLMWSCSGRGIGLDIQEVPMTGAAEITLYVDGKKKLDALAPAKSMDRTLKHFISRVDDEIQACGGV